MSEEGDFVRCLTAMLREGHRGSSWPATCEYDEPTRTALLTYRRPDGGTREVRLELPDDGVRHFLDSLSPDEIRFVWGPDVDRVEAAARFASVHLQERVATRDDDPLVIRYGVAR